MIKPRAYVYKSGAWVFFEKLGQWYVVKLYSASDEILDRVRCDDYRNALDYLRSFKAIAKNA